MENIQVALRVRPQSFFEAENNDREVWQAIGPSAISINPDVHADLVKTKKMGFGHRSEFSFNFCFDKYKTNVNIYDSLVQRIAISSLQGINGTIFMYGQTGSGKTFTMVGAREQYIPTHIQHSRSNEFNTPRTQSNNEIIYFGKSTKNLTYHTLNTQESDRSFDNPLRTAGKVSFYRSKSPVPIRDKTPRRTNDKSPMRITRDKSPIRADTQVNPKADFEFQQNKSSDNYNNTFGNFLNSHKRSSTLQYPHNQSIQSTSPQKPYDSSRACEMDNLKNHPGNIDGILMLAMKDIFNEIEKQTHKKFFLRCSYLEIYTDLVFDLLKSQDKLGEFLTINEDVNKGFYIKGATEEIVSSLDEILQKIKKGEANRHYASTTMNHTSSRSHTIFRLYVESMPANVDAEQGNYMTESVLNFVDLAGSEKVDIHDGLRHNRRESSLGGNASPPNVSPNSHKERVKENQHINKSLFFLTQVISLKSQGKPDLFIPYRNSPLTKILRSSLGGNSRTAIILCVNPNLSQIEQTISTLRFGLNAKKIENQVHANIICDAGDEMLKNLLREYEKKIMDMEMEKNQDKNTSEQLMKLIKNLQEQKNLLAERLQRLKKAELFPARINLLPFEHKSHDWEDLHYKNVGILHVLASRGRQRPYLGGDIEDKYASQSMRNLKEQNTILLEKIQKMTQKFEEFEKEKCELLEALATKDKHLAKKKNTIHHFSERINEFHVKNEQLQQIVNFYHNKNPEGIKRLSLEKLCKIESSLLSVLDNIKVHKALRIICQALPEELEDNENNALFKNYLYDMMEKDKNIKAHISFGEEIDFGTDFFDVIPMNKNTLTKTKFLNTMQKDPNIPVSVKCSIDPTTSYDSGDGEMMSPGIQNLNSFQNYFSSSVYKSDKYDMFENEEMEMLDSRLSKLRGSYKKIIDLIKRDNLDELVLQSSVSQVNMESKDASSAPQEIFSGKGVPLSSPKYRIDRLTNKENEYTNNLPSRSEDLKISNFMNPMGSVESTEAINSKMMGTTKIEDKPFQFKKLEKKKSIQKENIRVGNITLDVEKIEPKKNGLIYNDGNMSQRTAYVNLNLK